MSEHSYSQALVEGDPDKTGVWFGEVAGLIDANLPVEAIMERVVEEASTLLSGSSFLPKS